jgi:hypothetical protein
MPWRCRILFIPLGPSLASRCRDAGTTMMATHLPPSGHAPYLERAPEKLVVEGFRRWMAGYETQSIACWELAWALYAAELGPLEGRRALADLGHWVRTLRAHGEHTVSCFPYGCPRLCRDECFALTMIAALQNGDEASLAAALGGLVRPEGREAASEAASTFAATLGAAGQFLIPVPRMVIDDVASRPPRNAFH